MHIIIEIKIINAIKLATAIATIAHVIPSGPRKYFS
jgi:hypothetical protein